MRFDRLSGHRRVRNTACFLISNLMIRSAKDRVPRPIFDELDPLDLQSTKTAQPLRDAYEKCEFHVVYHSVKYSALLAKCAYMESSKTGFTERDHSSKRARPYGVV